MASPHPPAITRPDSPRLRPYSTSERLGKPGGAGGQNRAQIKWYIWGRGAK